MRTRVLGGTGLVASVLGLGANRIGESRDRGESRATFELALERGVNLVDLADSYGHGEAERLVGAWMGRRREKVIVCTKIGGRRAWSVRLGRLTDTVRRLRRTAVPVGGSRGRPRPRSNFAPRTIEAGVAGSLRRLGTEWIDVLYLHSPPPGIVADDEIFEALARQREAGRVRHVGISFSGAATTEDVIAGVRRGGVSVVQVRANVRASIDLDRVAAVAAPAGVAVVAREVFQKGALLLDGVDPSAALRAVIQRAGVDAVLVGTTRRNHLERNLAALDAPPLSDAEMAQLWSGVTTA